MYSTLIHYLIPGHTNNHKAKLLHSSTLALLTGVFVFYQLFLFTIPISGARILGYAANISVNEVADLTNLRRLENGASSLSINPQLSEAAKRKGEDMLAKDYWAHVSPDGIQPWKFFVDEGYKYKYAGENLARDFSNPQAVVDAWMASPTHRENLLSSKYGEVGIAVVEGDLNGVDTTLVVQFFGTRQGSSVVAVPVAAAVSEEEVVKEVIKPTPVPIVGNEEVDVPNLIVAESSEVKISPFGTTKGLSLGIVGSLIVVFVADGIAVSRKNIPRSGGRTFAHLAFLGMVFVIVLIARAGDIL